jgi:hypothetical protein
MRTRVNILKLSKQAALLVVDALVPACIDDAVVAAVMSRGAPDLELKTALAHFVKVEVPRESDLPRVSSAIDEVIQRNDWCQCHRTLDQVIPLLKSKPGLMLLCAQKGCPDSRDSPPRLFKVLAFNMNQYPLSGPFRESFVDRLKRRPRSQRRIIFVHHFYLCVFMSNFFLCL